jgi:hypothetical protein
MVSECHQPSRLPEFTSHAELAAVGIGLHHAGLSLDDRRAIENLYLKMVLKVVVATSVSKMCHSCDDKLMACRLWPSA